MSGISYSIVGIFALTIYIIISRNSLSRETKSLGGKEYANFSHSVLFYFSMDALWGICDEFHWIYPLYAVTIAYHIATALTVWFCARYMIAFLGLEKHLSKLLNILGCIFCVMELGALALNFSHSLFFNFDKSGNYQPGAYRDFAVGVITILFAIVTIETYIFAQKSTGLKRNKNFTISHVGMTLTVALVLQWLLPMWPSYTAGLLLSILIIRIFIHEEELQSASLAKTAFLFSMSHDIRTPMNAIIGYTELMKKHRNDPERCEDYLNKVQTSSQFLLSLINDVLEMARIESGKQTLGESVEQTNTIHTELADVYGELFRKKNIEFTHSSDIKTPFIYKDSVKLKEVFLNLVSNALKYTPEGGHVSVTFTELPYDKPGYTLIQTTITDDGVGMSPEFLQVLFEPFSRARSATDSHIEGTGLGMPIVKKLIELMGGTINVESKPGKGTTFVVTLPHRIATDAESSMVQPALTSQNIDLNGMRLLLAEDNDLNAEIAIEMLSEVGINIERATDGVVCVDMLKQHPVNYYDAILMDVQMPNMNGYEATKAIRQLDDERRNIPIIAMTANAFDEDRIAALNAGMNEHLTKPIEISKLYAALSTIAK